MGLTWVILNNFGSFWGNSYFSSRKEDLIIFINFSPFTFCKKNPERSDEPLLGNPDLWHIWAIWAILATCKVNQIFPKKGAPLFLIFHDPLIHKKIQKFRGHLDF